MSSMDDHVIFSGELPDILSNPAAAHRVQPRFGGGYTLRVGVDELALYSNGGRVALCAPGNHVIYNALGAHRRIEITFVRTSLCTYRQRIPAQRQIFLPNTRQPHQQQLPLMVDVEITYRIRPEIARYQQIARLSFGAVQGALSLFQGGITQIVEGVFRSSYLYSLRHDHLYLGNAIARELHMQTTLRSSELVMSEPISLIDIHQVKIHDIANLPQWPEEQPIDEFITYAGVLESAPCFHSGTDGQLYFRVPSGQIAVLSVDQDATRREPTHYHDDGRSYPVGQPGGIFAPDRKYMFMLLLRSDRLSRTERMTVQRQSYVPNTNPVEIVDLPVEVELEANYEIDLGAGDLQRVTSAAFKADLANLRTVLEQVAQRACNQVFLSELRFGGDHVSRLMTDLLNEVRSQDIRQRDQRNSQSKHFLEIRQIRLRHMRVAALPASREEPERPLVYFGALDSAPQAQFVASTGTMQLVLSPRHVAVVTDGTGAQVIRERQTKIGSAPLDHPGTPILIASTNPVRFELSCPFECFLPDPATARRSDQRFRNVLHLSGTYSLAGLRERRDDFGYTADYLKEIFLHLQDRIKATAARVAASESREMWRALLLPDLGFLAEDLTHALADELDESGVQVDVRVHQVEIDPAFNELLAQRWRAHIQEAQFALETTEAQHKARIASILTPQVNMALALQSDETIRALIATASQQLAEAYASRDERIVASAEAYAQQLVGSLLGGSQGLPGAQWQVVEPLITPSATSRPLFDDPEERPRRLSSSAHAQTLPSTMDWSLPDMPRSSRDTQPVGRSLAQDIELCRREGVTVEASPGNRYTLSFALGTERTAYLVVNATDQTYPSQPPRVARVEVYGKDGWIEPTVTLHTLDAWAENGSLIKIVEEVRRQLTA